MTAAIIGKNYTLTSSFTNEDNTPFIVSSPVKYKIFAFDNTYIVEGAACQNRNNPAEWIANFVIPQGAPVPNDVNNQQYYIDWYAENTDKNISMKAKQYFQVLAEAEPMSYDSAVAILVGQPLRDCLITDLPVLECNISVRDMNDKIYFEKDFSTDELHPEFRNNAYYTNFDSKTAIVGLTDRNMGICPYLIMYNYRTEIGYQTEVHTLYLVTGKSMLVVNSLRRYMDKARNFDIDPSLRWTDEELIHFVVEGLNRFNAAPPSITGFTIANFPNNYIYVLEKCACHEALNAWYLAEGARAFDFTGASVTLNVDRTQYIQTKMDEIGGWLNDNLEKIKALLIRQVNGNGSLSIQLTSVTNGFSRQMSGRFLQNLLRRGY